MSGPESQDVEMGEAGGASGIGVVATNGKGHGDVHMTNNNKDTAEQTASLPHTSLTFEVKQDLDGTQQQQQQQQHQSSVPPSSSPVSASSKMKSTAASKKKGTAAAKKGPKKTATTGTTTTTTTASKAPKTKKGAGAGAGGGVGGPGKKTKTKKTGGPKTAKAAAAAENGVEDSSDDETDNGPYCLCRGPDDHRWMIGCDVCEDWFHGECVNLDKEVGERLVERFVCPNCTDGKRNYTKYKKTCAFGSCRNVARLYAGDPKDRSVFCCAEHCDAWWVQVIGTLPSKAASKRALEVLTQEDFVGLLASTAEKGGWKLGDKPFGNIENLWGPNGQPTRPDVLSEEEQGFLSASAAERLALGNEIVQYKKMLQLIEWANARRQAALDAGKFAKESCGYDARLDAVSVRAQFAAWLDSAEGQATFKAGKLLDGQGGEGGSGEGSSGVCCEKKRCKPHAGWYKILTAAVRVLIKETATAAADKLEAEEVVRREAEVRYERRQLENNWVEVLDEPMVE